MKSRVLHRLLSFLLTSALCLPALAQFKRDASANQKIDEAINTHYLMMELDQAESMLKGIVDACADECSAGTKAKAWMYVGLVRGSGKNDLAGATEAFATAKSFDPNVRLDEGLATPETKAAFDSTPGPSGEITSSTPAPVAATAVATVPGEVPGNVLCTPETTDIATRMPIPVSCQSALGTAETAILRFKEFGGSEWQKIDMKKVGDTFQAEIPCASTNLAGHLEWYVGVKDKSDQYIDQYGSKKQPATFNLSDAGTTDLSFPGEAPLTRCAASEDCPPDFPGCSDSGSEASQAPAAEPFKKHWLGLAVGLDATFIGGEDLCSAERATSYSSYCLDTAGNLSNADIDVPMGGTLGQLRIKAAYDYALSPHWLVGARLGFAFMNTPSPGPGVTMQGFIPIHAELRASYAFTSLSNKGFRPIVFVNGGLMEMSTALAASTAQGVPLGVTVYKRGGVLGAGAGVSLGYAIQPHMVVSLEAGGVILFGTFQPTLAIHPALSFTYAL